MQRIAFVALLALASCQSAPSELTDSDRDAVTAEIEGEAQKYLDALMGRDIERWSALFRRDGFEMVVNGNLRESYDEVTTSFARRFSESWATAEGAWDGTRVRVLSSDAAVFRGYNHAVIEQTSGEIRHFPKVFFTLVYERLDDGWKISSIHESYDPSAVVTEAAPVDETREPSGS